MTQYDVCVPASLIAAVAMGPCKALIQVHTFEFEYWHKRLDMDTSKLHTVQMHLHTVQMQLHDVPRNVQKDATGVSFGVS